MLLVKPPQLVADRRAISWSEVVLLVGAAAILLPTMYDVARLTWTTEQGGHAPIILGTGAWLLWREWKSLDIRPRPGNVLVGTAALVMFLAAYVVFRITGILEAEGLAMYAALISAGYLLVGGAVLRALWFPIIYLAVALPPPDLLVAAITQPLKIAISQAAVWLLHGAGYPIASSGVTIQIANYQLLVAAACAGLNSIISLSAICLFYGYLRHRSDHTAFLIIAALIVPVAVFSNFVRVVALVLITYYWGEAAAQGFLHDFAGLTLFVVALLTIFGADALVAKIRGREARIL